MRVLLDTNILLDVLLNREPFVNDSSKLWAACDSRQITGYIPASTLTDIFFIARRAADLSTAHTAVALCLTAFEILPVDRQTLEQAVKRVGNDFEDNVQITCALIANLDGIVTRNIEDFESSPIPALIPAALIQRLS